MNHRLSWAQLTILCGLVLLAVSCAHGTASEAKAPSSSVEPASSDDDWEAAQKAEAKRREAALKAAPALDFPLLHNMDNPGVDDYVKMKEWKETDFDGQGKVRVDKDVVYLEHGNDLTGITWAGPLVKMNYEITLDAMRYEGGDFFCGLTFPVGEDHCSFIVGGWSGPVVGLSCLDFQDAYNNETARFKEFELKKWYHIRVRVTEGLIEAWIDDEKMVDIKTKGRGIDVRYEVERSMPLGIASWRTTGALRNIRLQALARPAKGAASK